MTKCVNLGRTIITRPMVTCGDVGEVAQSCTSTLNSKLIALIAFEAMATGDGPRTQGAEYPHAIAITQHVLFDPESRVGELILDCLSDGHLGVCPAPHTAKAHAQFTAQRNPRVTVIAPQSSTSIKSSQPSSSTSVHSAPLTMPTLESPATSGTTSLKALPSRDPSVLCDDALGATAM